MQRGQRPALRIAVVERDRERALMIVDGLREAGTFDVALIGDETGLERKLEDVDPDVVLIDLEDPSRDVVEGLALAATSMRRPVAMFVDRTDDELTRAAIEAGVSAYVVDGLRKDRLDPILKAAIARFSMLQRIRAELEATKAALAERKTIDRAKGILMKARGLSEDEAYALMRKTAMDGGKRIGDVAQALVTAHELLS